MFGQSVPALGPKQQHADQGSEKPTAFNRHHTPVAFVAAERGKITKQNNGITPHEDEHPCGHTLSDRQLLNFICVLKVGSIFKPAIIAVLRIAIASVAIPIRVLHTVDNDPDHVRTHIREVFRRVFSCIKGTCPRIGIPQPLQGTATIDAGVTVKTHTQQHAIGSRPDAARICDNKQGGLSVWGDDHIVKFFTKNLQQLLVFRSRQQFRGVARPTAARQHVEVFQLSFLNGVSDSASPRSTSTTPTLLSTPVSW